MKPLQNTHGYTHTLIQTEEKRGLGRKRTHIRGAYIYIGAQRNTRIHTRAYTYTIASKSTKTETSRETKPAPTPDINVPTVVA